MLVWRVSPVSNDSNTGVAVAAVTLLNQHMIHYAGKQFPTASQGPKVDFVLLQVFDGETNGEWKSGFYQFDDDITQIEATVQSHHATVAHVDAK
jgi:hypothetical protein